MKNILFALTIVAFGLNTGVSQRIAIVDINTVLDAVPEYKIAEKEIDRIAAEWRQQISKEYDAIKSMYNKYQAEQVLLSEDAKVERENEIIKKEEEVRELQKLKFGPEGELFKKRQQMITPIQDKVFNAINDYASDRGFDLIFDKSGSAGLLFTSDEFDKTQDIINRVKR